MIEINNFTKNYYNLFQKEPSFSVQNISLKIEAGHIYGLLGPNGSGKSTIMKAVCGFHYPSDGEILLSDNENHTFDVTKTPQIINELIGYVPEKSILPPEMYVYDFLNYCAELHNLENQDKTNAINLVVKECTLEKVLGQKIKTLSKGYSQRLSFAQAIIHNPPNLILDEPVSGLDPAQIIQMRNLIKKMSQSKAVLMSTHLLQEVYSLCDELCIISNGKIVSSGTEKDILKDSGCDNLEKAFIKLTESGEN